MLTSTVPILLTHSVKYLSLKKFTTIINTGPTSQQDARQPPVFCSVPLSPPCCPHPSLLLWVSWARSWCLAVVQWYHIQLKKASGYARLPPVIGNHIYSSRKHNTLLWEIDVNCLNWKINCFTVLLFTRYCLNRTKVPGAQLLFYI